MRIDIPVLLTPLNVIGLSHASTYLELNRKKDFDSNSVIFSKTQSNGEKNTFIIPYKLAKNEVAFLRYKVIFQNGQSSSFSPPMMITSGNSKKEYSLDFFSSIPATPRLSIMDYDFSTNVPHVDLTLVSDELTFYVGLGTHISSSWYVMDAHDKILWENKDNTFDLNSIVIDKDIFKKDGIFKLGITKKIESNGQKYDTLMANKIINISDNDGLSDADMSLNIDLNSFSLYSGGQSVLHYTHGIVNFQYLSIKLYDRNGILTGDEIRAIKSPVYINTGHIEVGRNYNMQVLAYYIDGDGNIRNTLIKEKMFIAEKYALPTTVATTDYGDFSELGYHEVNGYQDEDIVYFNFTNSFTDGQSPIFIKENVIYLGYWLEDGYILSQHYINIKNLNISSNHRVQMIQKNNGKYLLLGVSSLDNSKVKIVDFYTVNSINNIALSIEISAVEMIDNIILDALANLSLNRMVFNNNFSENIIHSFIPKTTNLWGSVVPCNYYKELQDGVLIDRKSFSTNGFNTHCAYSNSSLLMTELNKNTITGAFHLELYLITISIIGDITKELVNSVNTIDNIDNEVVADLKENLFNTNLHNDGIIMGSAMLDTDDIIVSVKDKKDNTYGRYFRYNLSTNVWSKIMDNTGLGKEYQNLVLSGFNIFKTKLGKNPVRLKQ